MARANSVILSPAEKKAALADLKAQIKLAKAAKKDADSAVKNLEKEFKANLKPLVKAAADADKALAKLEGALEKLADTEAVAA